MSAAASPGRARERSRTPRLRLLRSAEDMHAGLLHHEGASRPSEDRPGLRLVASPPHVLVAGADAARRATLLDELTQTMPQSTRFEEASAVWEVLEHAPTCRIVILSGDLDDAPAESLMHMLGHRHPGLPVVSIDAPAQG